MHINIFYTGSAFSVTFQYPILERWQYNCGFLLCDHFDSVPNFSSHNFLDFFYLVWLRFIFWRPNIPSVFEITAHKCIVKHFYAFHIIELTGCPHCETQHSIRFLYDFFWTNPNLESKMIKVLICKENIYKLRLVGQTSLIYEWFIHKIFSKKLFQIYWYVTHNTHTKHILCLALD